MWMALLAMFFFVAGLLMLLVRNFLPHQKAGPFSLRDQALLYSTAFVLAGFLTLSIYAVNR